MSTKASKVSTKHGDYENVLVLQAENGLYIKEDNKLTLVLYETVNFVVWEDSKAMQKVWTEALAEWLEDVLDDDDWEEQLPDKTTEEKPEEKSDSPDDPEANPYS